MGHRHGVAVGQLTILPAAAVWGDLRTAAAPTVANVAAAIHEAPAAVHEAASAAAAVHKATTAADAITAVVHLHTLGISEFDHQRHFGALHVVY